MNNKTLIKNATIVNEGASTISDILIEGQIISKIDKEINIESPINIVNADNIIKSDPLTYVDTDLFLKEKLKTSLRVIVVRMYRLMK